MRRLTPLIVLLSVAVLLSGCGLLPEQIDKTRDWSASQLYTEAKDSLNSGAYEEAIKYYETLEGRYPFSRFAQQAQIETAYAYYRMDEPELAIAAIDRFINLHPQHPHVDYAYYLKGIVNFNRGRGLLDRVMPRDISQTDTAPLRQSFEDFGILVRSFPESRYSEDARLRMIYLRNALARHELHVAAYYMRRGAWAAAAQRGAHVIEHFQQSDAVPDALAAMIRSYRNLGLDTQADDTLRVLRQNFPDRAAELERTGN